MTQSEENYHNDRIIKLEDSMINLMVWQAKCDTTLTEIKKKLENGISVELKTLNSDMSLLMPYMNDKKEWDKTIKISILTIVFSGAAAMILFVMRLYFVHI